MKIRLLSDLHLEFQSIHLDSAGEDLIILAGDIGIYTDGVTFAKKLATQLNVAVLILAGNHELYGNSWEETLVDCAAAADHTDKVVKGEVTFLEDAAVEYMGVRFIGATLWTDMKLYGDDPLVPYIVSKELNDYYQIYSGDGDALTTDQTMYRHGVSREFITNTLRQPFDGPTVVVTHHAPSWLSVHERYRTDKVSAGFASRLEDLMLDYEPVLWCHGHCHHAADYQIGNTRIVTNPRGYPGEGTGFDPNFIVEV